MTHAKKIAYLYSAGSTVPWLAMKYGSSLAKAGAMVELFEIGTRKESPVNTHNDYSLKIFKWKKTHKLFHGFQKICIFLSLWASKADIYIAGDPKTLGLASFVSKLTRSRLVYLPFEYFPGILSSSEAKRKRYAEIEKRYIPNASSVIVCGDKIADDYREQYGLNNNLYVVYNAWPKVEKRPEPALRKKLSLGDSDRIVLYQGVISVKRGLVNVVEALRQLPSDVIFVMMGYGDDIDIIRQKAVEVGVLDKIRFVDAVSRSELISYTCDADIGILPILNVCRSYYLCNPGKLFEYIAAGLPIAASNLLQLQWYINKENLGVVFDPENPDNIAKALSVLLSDENYRKKCAFNSREVHLRDACWEVQSDRLFNAVKGV